VAGPGLASRWEIALVGNNLTDRLTAGSCLNSNYAGGSLSRHVWPRLELWLRLTFRPRSG
jgi:hypothetical protein